MGVRRGGLGDRKKERKKKRTRAGALSSPFFSLFLTCQSFFRTFTHTSPAADTLG